MQKAQFSIRILSCNLPRFVFLVRMQISTAISDLVLALVSTWVGLSLYASGKGSVSKRGGAWGFFSIALGAYMGTVFFLGGGWISPVYRPVVQFAGEVGVPWIGIGFFAAGFGKVDKKTWTILTAALIALFIFDLLFGLGQYATAIGAVSFITVLVVSIRKYGKSHKTPALYGILGALLFMLAGLVIGTVGSTLGVPNVDIFHYALAAANYALGYSLKKLG